MSSRSVESRRNAVADLGKAVLRFVSVMPNDSLAFFVANASGIKHGYFAKSDFIKLGFYVLLFQLKLVIVIDKSVSTAAASRGRGAFIALFTQRRGRNHSLELSDEISLGDLNDLDLNLLSGYGSGCEYDLAGGCSAYTVAEIAYGSDVELYDIILSDIRHSIPHRYQGRGTRAYRRDPRRSQSL